jgi:mono/diheme cytochrome c family protein
VTGPAAHRSAPRRRLGVAAAAALLGAGLLAVSGRGAAAEEPDLVARGAYLVRAGGCVACHTDLKGGGPTLAGGRALKTPFGVFFTPNLTPDPESGIGAWSEADFLGALRQGLRPDGSPYYPAFPYTTYARMTEGDARAIRAYLFSLEPVRRPSRPHDLIPPFGWRPLLHLWRLLFFEPGALTPDPARPEGWNRGAYLVEALAHCGECHTPRNVLGAPDRALWLAGSAQGPEGQLAPNITPDRATGIGDWSASEIVELLRSGLKPDFDDVQGAMAEAIEHGLKHLGEDDLAAIAEYLRALAPIANRVERKRP